jgi:hypothetical protein
MQCLAARFEESSLSQVNALPPVRTSTRKPPGEVEEARAEKKPPLLNRPHMRSLAACFELSSHLSSVDSPDAVVPPSSQPKDQPHSEKEATLSHVREKRKGAVFTSTALDFVALSACDEGMVNKCEEAHTDSRKRRCSQETVAEAEPPKARQRMHEAELRPLSRSSFADDLTAKSPSSDKASDDIGWFELGRKSPNQSTMADLKRPISSRGNGTLSSTSMLSICLPGQRGTLGNVSTAGTVGVSPKEGSVDDDGRSRMGSRCESRMSRQDSIGSSLSGWSSSWSALPGASNFAVMTPPGASDAFQAHEMLVKCPAPKRIGAVARIPVARGMNRTTSRSSLSVLEASHTADDLVALRRNGSRVQLQCIHISAEDLAEDFALRSA